MSLVGQCLKMISNLLKKLKQNSRLNNSVPESRQARATCRPAAKVRTRKPPCRLKYVAVSCNCRLPPTYEKGKKEGKKERNKDGKEKKTNDCVLEQQSGAIQAVKAHHNLHQIRWQIQMGKWYNFTVPRPVPGQSMSN